MTYSDIISLVEREVRDARVWPENAAGNKLAEQIRYVFACTVVVMNSVEWRVLIPLIAEEELTFEEEGTYVKAPLPGNLFFTRPDYGVQQFLFGGERYRPQDAVPFDTVRTASANYLHCGNFVFMMAGANAVVYANGDPGEAALLYVPMPVSPTEETVGDLDFPLPAPHDEQVAQLTAAHLEAIRTGDRGLAAVHNAMAVLYGESVSQSREGGEGSGDD